MPPLNVNILVIDDEANIRKTVARSLESAECSVVTAADTDEALRESLRTPFDVAFLDIRLERSSGLDLLPQLLAHSPWMKIIVMSAYGTIDIAVESMKRGAFDFIQKPFSVAQIRHAAAKAAEVRALERRVHTLEHELSVRNPAPDFTSMNAAVARTLGMAQQAAHSEATILLLGESGTGKSQLARAIHQWSPRKDRPFVTVSCPALSAELLESELFGHAKGAFTGALRETPGKIAVCDGGTLMLDEIGDLPLALQPKLLRFLQERAYERVGDTRTRSADVRVIAATNKDLQRAVESGAFREDLYHRLNVIMLELPPLRERREDIALLTKNLLSHFAAVNNKPGMEIDAKAMEEIIAYRWPGNLRELRNAIERAVIFSPGGTLYSILPQQPADSPESVLPMERIPLAKLEELHIRRVLSSASSISEAAELLGIDQATLWRKRKLYSI